MLVRITIDATVADKDVLNDLLDDLGEHNQIIDWEILQDPNIEPLALEQNKKS